MLTPPREGYADCETHTSFMVLCLTMPMPPARQLVEKQTWGGGLMHQGADHSSTRLPRVTRVIA